MKLCSQCEFIYEDDQELCDMDGAQLVYEPTLEHVFPRNETQAKVELERTVPATSLVALPRPSQPQTLPADNSGTRRKFALQIAAGFALAVVTFLAFYAYPSSLRGSNNVSGSPIVNQPAKVEPTNLAPAASSTFAFDPSENQNAKPEVSRSADEPNNGNSKPHAVVPALPGLKPLPRLKPLPTLKPIPRFGERQSLTVGRKTTVIQNPPAKKESRFGSFLKKTGRIFKKPFKS